MRSPPISLSSVVVGILSFLCLCLLYANNRLVTATKTIAAQRDSLESGKGPVVGSMMTHLSGVDTRVANTDGDHGTTGTLVFVFSPECAFCKANAPQWNDLLRTEPNFRIILADLSGTQGGGKLIGLSSRPDVLAMTLNPEEQLLHNLHVTPTTLLLDRAGKIKGVWSGLLSSDNLHAIHTAAASLHG